jgi:hypothetical protein
MKQLVDAMLMNDGNCSNLVLPSILAGDIQLRPFTDSSNNITYCIAMDHKDSDANGKWDNGYFMFATPNRRYDVQRRAHLAAPHPGTSEVSTVTQAVKIFQAIGGNSYLAFGMAKNANTSGTLNTCHNPQYPSEPLENDILAFHNVFIQIYNTSESHVWNATYIQMHGMVSCPGTSTDVFVSNGMLGPTYYPSGCLANNVRDAVKTTYPNTQTGGENSCNGIGATGIQGRVVNGIAVADACTGVPSAPSHRFLHIEQKSTQRSSSTNQQFWYDAFRATLPTDCAPGRSYDSSSKMCI